MSKFNVYAQRVDSMAREVFVEYAEAKAEFEGPRNGTETSRSGTA